jgi:two-component system chemotaxis response regulator CheB
MPTRDIVVIGASTGGREALQQLVERLPEDFGGSIFIVLHTGPSSPDILDRMLMQAGPLPAANAKHWKPIKPGHIYVAPADYHLLLDRSGYTLLTRGPRENRFRPAIDPLFRSAAQAFGPRVVGVILTGQLDDGTAGLWSVKQRGGVTVVQQPQDAVAPSMPASALRNVPVDHCVRLKDIAPLLARLVHTPAEEKEVQPPSESMEAEIKIAKEENALDSGVTQLGEPSLFACPECHGVLLQLKEGSHLRFRCHTGHAYSLETLLAEFRDQTEITLWNAIRSMEENILLMHRMAEQLEKHDHTAAAQAMRQNADELHRRADVIRQAALTDQRPKSDEPAQS